jgi:hypothetical protein
MHVEVTDGRVTDVAAAHLRAAPVLRGVPAGPGPHRAARSHRAHLRDLPGGVPDERVSGHRGRVRRDRGRPASPTLRRLLYCGEWIESHALHVYLLHAPDFLGAAERHRAGRGWTGPRWSGACGSRRWATTSSTSIGGRAIHPVNVRVGGFYRVADPAPSCAALVGTAASRPGSTLETVTVGGGLRLPRPRRRPPPRVAAGSRRTYPVFGRPGGLERRASTSPRPTTSTRSSASTTSRAPPPCTAASTGGRFLVGPLARYGLNAGAALAGRPGGGPHRRPGRGVPQPVPAASSSGPSRWCTRARSRWR